MKIDNIPLPCYTKGQGTAGITTTCRTLFFKGGLGSGKKQGRLFL